MGLIFNIACFSTVAIVYALYRRAARISLSKVPGPPSYSFFFGNLCELLQSQASEADFKWQEQYGGLVRFKGTFGEDRLLISDPKALRYIYQTAGYDYPRQQGRLFFTRLMTGKGILWADGDVHKRHRKVMLPAFRGPESRAFVPLFFLHASKLTTKWKDLVAASPDQSAVLDIPDWLSRATLDAIGEAAFDFHIGAINHEHNELEDVYTDIFTHTFGLLSNRDILMQNIIPYIPLKIREFMADNVPNPKLRHVLHMGKVATKVAKSLVDSKTEALLEGKGNRDVLSLLLKANASEDEKTQLSEEEVLAQMRTIILAGHETTANTLSWLLLELARHPEIQSKLRQEIREHEATLHARGDFEFTANDLDGMQYLAAVIKEILRYHPVVYNIFRQAGKDDVLPLSKPIITDTGEVLNEMPIPKGVYIIASIAGYNRNKEIFGEDSHTFNPNRWIDGTTSKENSIGVYSNLMSFSGGVRSCLGWRFAIQEIQTFIVEIINNFEFEITPKAHHIRREACLMMVPMIDGEIDKGTQLPLRVTAAARET